VAGDWWLVAGSAKKENFVFSPLKLYPYQFSPILLPSTLINL